MKYIVVCSLLALVLACSKGASNKNNSNYPTAGPQSLTQQRADTSSIFRFTVGLSAAATSVVSIDFATQDGTAKANTDYLPKTGTLTIPVGKQQGYVDILVTGDSLRRAEQVFYLQLTNPVNCNLTTNQVAGTIVNDGTYLPTDTSGFQSPTSYPGYTLTWSDEFNANTVNTNNWNFETGNNNGWGNGELEFYTARTQNVFQSCGHLIIEARQEDFGGSNYTSARIKTQGSQQFQYGRIDIRAKLPVSTGLWPALWMLGSNFPQIGWPACGETDIMELVGLHPSQVVGSLHWAEQGGEEGSHSQNYNLASGDFSEQFHVFSLIWQSDTLQMLVDDSPYMSLGSSSVGTTWPFNNPFFFIFNVAVGGNWPGPPNETTVFPQRMFVDYVRVFQ
jgi:beta-glucanase (GH16 family)